MNLFKSKILHSALLSLGLVTGTATASASTMELALAIDGSGSMSASEWNLQIDGYVNVFNSGSFYDTYVAPSQFDSLWVSAFQFATTVQQETAWFEITSNADAQTFAGMLSGMTQLAGWTNTEGAIFTSMNSILDNGIDSQKMVIDISTDGQPTICDGGTSSSSLYNGCTSGTPYSEAIAAADAARAEGVTVNALGIGTGVNSTFLNDLVDSDGFYMQTSFLDFGGSIAEKLGREVTGVPEPSAILLLGSGLLLFGFTARRRRG